MMSDLYLYWVLPSLITFMMFHILYRFDYVNISEAYKSESMGFSIALCIVWPVGLFVFIIRVLIEFDHMGLFSIDWLVKERK